MRGISTRGANINFGEYALKAQGRGWIASNQIEAARRVLVRHLRKGGRMWIRIFPDKPITARPAGQRMGSGKGDVDKFVAVVTPGRILFEVTGIDEDLARQALQSAANKLPIKTKFITREE
ncbi:unnamed protein product [marine sediment metagenome]|uniref:Uncharacterized protein n=1 Tax=marine sediment metagenome TaxID=412755 RepID=X0W791_9ZZZZ